MPLTVGVTPFSPWACLSPLLEHLGCTSTQSGPDTAYQEAQGPWLLLHTRPEYALAVALDEGHNSQTALDAWKTDAQALLNFYKSQRRKAAMAELYAVARHPGELASWLTDNHDGFAGQFDPQASADLELDAPPLPSELSLLIATQLVAQTPALKPLLAQLEASSIPLGTDHYAEPTVDVVSVTEQLNEQINGPQAKQERLRRQLEEHEQRLKSENELLLTQLHTVQEELEAHYHKAQNGTKSLEELQAQNAELKQQLEQLTEQQSAFQEKEKDLESENDLILKQLFQVQEELEKYYLDDKANVEKLEKSKSELKAARKALEKAEKSEKQLKTTQKELKAAQSDYASLEQKLKDSEQQTVILQAELAEAKAASTRLQTELNASQTLSAHTGRQLQELQRTRERLQKEKDDLGVENYQLSSELALANIELRNARKKLHFVEQSTSWRLTNPLRKAAKLVNKSSRGRELVENHVQLIKQSDLFDPKWYLNNNSDLKEKGVDPAEHYVMYGGKEGRAPSPKFNAREYLKKYPDVAESGQNPLVHYLLHGKTEGRKI